MSSLAPYSGTSRHLLLTECELPSFIPTKTTVKITILFTLIFVIWTANCRTKDNALNYSKNSLTLICPKFLLRAQNLSLYMGQTQRMCRLVNGKTQWSTSRGMLCSPLQIDGSCTEFYRTPAILAEFRQPNTSLNEFRHIIIRVNLHCALLQPLSQREYID